MAPAKIQLDTFMLPREKVSIAQENKKIYAFGANGSCSTIRLLLDMLKE